MSSKPAAQAFLEARAGAYRRVFGREDADVKDVLADLAKFCRAHESTFHGDARAAAQLEGRREVWLRIQEHLRLTDEQLWLLYGGAQGRMLNRPLNKETIDG